MASDENDYGYTLLSDPRHAASLAFGLAFEASMKTRERYKGYGIPLYAAEDGGPPLLPVPAVFLVDGDGVVRFRYFDPDFKVRLDGKELLAEARRLVADTD